MAADNRAIGAHVFGRTFMRVRVRPCAAAAARKTWELVVGPASGLPPCPVFAGITLPEARPILISLEGGSWKVPNSRHHPVSERRPY